jgi:hypothetical protein
MLLRIVPRRFVMKETRESDAFLASCPGERRVVPVGPLMLTVVVLVLLFTVRAIAEVGPPFQAGGDAVYGAAAFNQEHPAVAFDGSNYLVVWEDSRGDTRDIYAARVSASGIVLDSSGIAISAAAYDQCSPAVAFDGTNYLVTWEDYRSGSEWDIYCARVSSSGSVLDTSGVPLSTAISDQRYPAVGFDGVSYLVVWDDLRAGDHDVYATRVDTSGGVRDTAGVAVSTATGGQFSPALAFDGTNYLVVWDDNRSGSYDIYGARVDTAGAVLDASGIAISVSAGDQWYPTVGCDGEKYLVVWDDHRGSSWDIYGARVDTTGAVRDTAGIGIATEAHNEYSPDLSFDGTNYFIAWDDDRGTSWDIYGARVDTSGTIVDVSGVAISAADDNQYWSRVAFGTTDYLVVWQDNRGASRDIFGARVTTSVGVLDPEGVAVSTTANNQLETAVAFGRAMYLVVWEDGREDSSGIYAARLGVSGAALDPEGITVCSATGPKNDPAVAFDGANYFTVWADYRSGTGDIYGARVDTFGTVLDPGGFVVSSATDNQRDPSVSFDGTNYLVVWTDRRSGSTDIYGARVEPSGVVLDVGGLAISGAAGSQAEPTIAFNGKDYLVAWEDSRNGSWDVYGARVDTSGFVRDTADISISSEAGDQSSPAAAFDSVNFMVVWEDRRSGSGWDIYGARIDTSGSVLDASGIAVSEAASDQLHPALAFSEMGYLVAWDDGRNGHSSDIYAARLAISGALLDPDGVLVSGSTLAEHRPAVASGPVCALLLAYESFAASPYGVYRVWGNIWSGPTVLTFASAAASAEGGCVTLSWQMGVEVPAHSFVIERSESPDEGFGVLDLPVTEGPRLSFHCRDETVLPDRTYWYRIRLSGVPGEEVCGPIQVRTTPAPTRYRVHQSYPNPFNPFCTIRYEIPLKSKVLLRVFDVSGSVVRTLLDDWMNAGAHSEVWDGRGDSGEELSSGVYFYRLDAGGFSAVHKTVLLR